jgi:hypothetical protein
MSQQPKAEFKLTAGLYPVNRLNTPVGHAVRHGILRQKFVIRSSHNHLGCIRPVGRLQFNLVGGGLVGPCSAVGRNCIG